MKIVIDSDIPYIRGRLEPFAETLYVDQWGFTPENVKDADAMIIRTRTRCNRELLEGSSVKAIATATIGMDQFDLEWCREAGIHVRNAPGCNAPAVAQYVWSCLLREGFDPAKHTLGVVGCGHVGSIVADWGRRLGAKILVNDPPKAEAGELEGEHTELADLLAQSDAVTLHTPMTKTGKHPSYHLIGERELSRMRNGAILINAARGPVLETAALVKELEAGRLRAVIDTWEGEPNLNRDLLRLSDIATFHIAGYSDEGKQRATRMAVQAIADRFGLDVDTSDLAPAYTPPAELTAEKIVASFDPTPIMESLRKNPEEFDRLRAAYKFRPEVR